jgi:hypothetical protein
VPESFSYSKKKTAYIFKEGGDKVTCTIKNLGWKKGLIDDLKILDLDGKKVKVSPEEIDYMYLPPSNFNKLGTALDAATDAQKWDNSDLDKDLLEQNLVYFEKSDVKIKKKTFTVMLQVLNPSFCKEIRVYNDPYAKETMSVGVGPITAAGGNEKSYFIKKDGEKTAYKVEKKTYKEEFKMIFSDCPALLEKYGADPKWSDFQTHVWEYSQECKK